MKHLIAILFFASAVALMAADYRTYVKDRCEWCGTKGSLFNQLNVHHFIPQHIAPELRNDPDNLVTLCRADHFSLGHKRNWTNNVPEIRVLFRHDNAIGK